MSANLLNFNRFIFTLTYLLLFYYHINSCVLMRSVIIVIKNVCMYVCTSLVDVIILPNVVAIGSVVLMRLNSYRR